MNIFLLVGDAYHDNDDIRGAFATQEAAEAASPGDWQNEEQREGFRQDIVRRKKVEGEYPIEYEIIYKLEVKT